MFLRKKDLLHLRTTCQEALLRRLITLLTPLRVCSPEASALVTIPPSASATSGKPVQDGQVQQEPAQNYDESTLETSCSRPLEQLTCAR